MHTLLDGGSLDRGSSRLSNHTLSDFSLVGSSYVGSQDMEGHAEELLTSEIWPKGPPHLLESSDTACRRCALDSEDPARPRDWRSLQPPTLHLKVETNRRYPRDPREPTSSLARKHCDSIHRS
jgi:hypothetical protein